MRPAAAKLVHKKPHTSSGENPATKSLARARQRRGCYPWRGHRLLRMSSRRVERFSGQNEFAERIWMMEMNYARRLSRAGFRYRDWPARGQTARRAECDPGAESSLGAFAANVRQKWPSQGRRPTRSPQRAAMRLPGIGVPVPRECPAARGVGDRRFRTPGSWPSFSANRAPIAGEFLGMRCNILMCLELCRSFSATQRPTAGRTPYQNHARVANCCSIAHTTRAWAGRCAARREWPCVSRSHRGLW